MRVLSDLGRWQPSPRRAAVLNLLARLLVFLIFAAVLYQTEYARVRDAGFWLDAPFRANVRAINVGHPFYFYPGDDLQPTTVDEDAITRWPSCCEDYGNHILLASVASVGRTLDDDFAASGKTPYQAIFGIFLLTGFAFLLPNVPLPLSLGGVLALGVGIGCGPIMLSLDPRFWAVTYMVLLVGMMIATAALPKQSPWNALFFLLMSVLIGYALLIRQSGSATVYAGALALIGLAWGMAAITFFVLRDRDSWRQSALIVARRATLSGVVMLLAVFITPYVIRGFYSLAWHTSYADTPSTQHQGGLAAYLGTGYVSNPYNIVWLDLIGGIHARLEEPEVEQFHDDPHTQAVLNGMWRDIVIESPWLILENMVQKARFIEYFLRNGKPLYPTGQLAVEQSSPMRAVYFLAVVSLLLHLAALMFRPHPVRLLPVLAFVALALGSAAGPLIAFPGYIGGPQGATLALVFLLPIAFWIPPQDPVWPAPSLRKIVLLTSAALTGLIFLGGVMVGLGLFIQHQRFDSKLDDVRQADPLTEIETMGYRYDHYFNALDQDDQEAIIAELLASPSENVAVPTDDSQQDEVFAPQVAVLTENQLHLIVWLDADYPGPVDFINQARTHSIVQVCGGCEEITRNFDYAPDSIVYTFLNDSDWNDSYRMLSFPVDASAFTDAGTLLVVPQRLRFLGGNATDFDYMVDELPGVHQMRFN